MTIYIGSRYQTATLDMVTDAEGDTNIVAFRGPSPLAAPISFFNYQVVSGDTLSALAYRFYDREDYWWLIADANPGTTLDPLPGGAILRVPNVIG